MQSGNSESWRASLNVDLKNAPVPSLPPNAGTMSEGRLSGHFFLQIEEIVNVLASALKQYSETTPRRMLKLRLTDGAQTITAVEEDKITYLSVSTPPGTKVMLMGPVSLSCGFWLIQSHHIKLLGGSVPHMLRSWEIHRDVVIQGKRLTRADDRPEWVPFGQPLKFDQNTLKFRAMQIVDKNAAAADNDEDDEEEEDERSKEFALHRQQVLQAARGDDGQLSISKIGPVNRRAPELLKITGPYMSAEEPTEVKQRVVKELPRDARDFIDKSDPGVEPATRGFRGRGRGGRGRGGRRGGRGRGRGGDDGFEDYGNAPPPRTANLMDFVNLSIR
ncbi:putative Tudor domain-containing protein 3 [Hypsibius exemplaris]|uniref:RecQ-mediated genome instability protein 1 n=1 Tax=Hypsibius exemplaris TaxID=2072580 RepID=A0A1W0WY44_HYPEX|nr:putative Tudor domain-containing protein 3 [Hypsibius exemplaris]